MVSQIGTGGAALYSRCSGRPCEFYRMGSFGRSSLSYQEGKIEKPQSHPAQFASVNSWLLPQAPAASTAAERPLNWIGVASPPQLDLLHLLAVVPRIRPVWWSWSCSWYSTKRIVGGDTHPRLPHCWTVVSSPIAPNLGTLPLS